MPCSQRGWKRGAIVVLLVLLALSMLYAETPVQKVRVGFYAFDSYHEIDSDGRRSGYGYDFLSLLRRYANVQFEYVGYEKGWEENLEMLLSGEIDVVTGANKTEERLDLFDYSLPIGVTPLTLKVRAGDDRYIPDDYSTYDGMAIAVLEGSITEEKLAEFASKNGFSFSTLDCNNYREMEEALESGRVDAMAATLLSETAETKTLDEFSSENFYAIVKKGNAELLALIDDAIMGMNASEGNWQGTLYYQNYGISRYNSLTFTEEEKAYMSAHSAGRGSLTLALDRDWDPFSYEENGVYKGIILDYWKLLMEMTGMDYTIYGSNSSIIDENVVLEGKADVYLGYCFDAEYAEKQGFVSSSPFLTVSACYLKRKDHQKTASIGVLGTNTRLNSLLPLEEGQYTIAYESSSALLDALSDGNVDAAFLYSLEAEYFINKDNSNLFYYQVVPEINLPLTAITSDSESHLLITILSKCINHLAGSEMNAIIARNMATQINPLRFRDYLVLYPITSRVIGGVFLTLLFFAYVVFFRSRMEASHRKSLEEKVSEISSLNEELQNNQRELKDQFAFAEAMSRNTADVFILNTRARSSTAIKLNGSVLPRDARSTRRYDETWTYYIAKYVYEDDRVDLARAVELDYVIHMLQRKTEHTHRYRIVTKEGIQNYQVTFTYLGEKGAGDVTFGFRCIDDIVKVEQEQNLILSEARKAAETRLHEISSLNEQLLENSAIISNAGYGIWRIQLVENGRNRMVANEKLQGIFGIEDMHLSPEELYVFYHARLLEDVSQIEAEDYKEMLDGELKSRVLEWNHPTRGHIYLQAGGTCHMANGEKLITGYCGDITEQEMETERLNRSLKEAQKQAAAANEAKSNFLFNMSHDIRTPMNAILGFTQLMKGQTDNPAVIKDYLAKLETSGEYLLSLINNVLDMARIDSGKVELDENVMDIGSDEGPLFDMFSSLLLKKNLTFNRFFHVEHPYIIGDYAKLSQILTNLLSNAIKYTPEGGTVSLDVREVPCEKEGYATFVTTVSDTGIGMSQEFITHIFEAFSRERTTTESKVVGTGLGMAIVKKYADLMGAEIEIESELGKGSVFRVRHTNKISSAPESYPVDRIREQEMDLKGKRVLLAEDNDLNALIASAILAELGIETERAEDGVIVVDMFSKAEPDYYDLILMDVQMPNMDGYEATRTIRSFSDPKKASVPIVAMTANAFEKDRRNALASGMDAHLTKPIEIPKLVETIASVLKRNRTV